jgi:thioester reductase-like protein
MWRASKEYGIPIAIYRPGMVTGHSITGHCHPTDFVPRFIRGCYLLRSYPDGLGDMELIPVDHTASVITRIAHAIETSLATTSSSSSSTTTTSAAQTSWNDLVSSSIGSKIASSPLLFNGTHH